MEDKRNDEILLILQLLSDYLDHIIIGGGWAPILYFEYHLSDTEKFNLFTKDYDFFVPKKLMIKGSKTVDKILTDAGLSPNYLGGSTPPIIHYEGNIFGKDVEIEFLTDKSYARTKDAIKVQEGLIAETLEYLKICIDNTMKVNVVINELNNHNKMLGVNIPTPTAFVFNKGMVFTRRKDPQKRAKDLYYIFNFISYSEALSGEITNGLKQLSSKYNANWINTFKSNLDKYFMREPKTGIEMVIEQRPAGDFLEMEESQFRNYVENIFIKFIESIND